MGAISRPALLDDSHSCRAFDCGYEALNTWLKRNGLRNQRSNSSKTYVICDGSEVVGYFSLASGSVERVIAPSNLARNAPDPIPVVVLGRLAIDIRYQGQQLGAALMREAILATLRVSEIIGARGLVVHALNDEAAAFYQRLGFKAFPTQHLSFFLSINDLKRHCPDR